MSNAIYRDQIVDQHMHIALLSCSLHLVCRVYTVGSFAQVSSPLR